MEWNKGATQVPQGTYLIWPWNDAPGNLFWSAAFWDRPGAVRTDVAARCGSYVEAQQRCEDHAVKTGQVSLVPFTGVLPAKYWYMSDGLWVQGEAMEGQEVGAGYAVEVTD